MNTLFPLEPEPADPPSIPGLSYHSAYVSEQEEAALARAIDAEPWDTTWERRRQLYGASYGSGEHPVRPIPLWAVELAKRMHSEGLSEQEFDQMLVNEYLPGQGIAMHHDHQPFGRTVVSLSLLAAWVMDFDNPTNGERRSMLLERRSLLVLSDEARYRWRHGIARRKSDRWQGSVRPRSRRLSITFRWRNHE